MISLIAITVVFGLGWAIRQLWNLAAPAFASLCLARAEVRPRAR